jgi:hypothetical protein
MSDCCIWRDGGAVDAQWVLVRGAANILAMRRSALGNKESSIPNVSNAAAEKSLHALNLYRVFGLWSPWLSTSVGSQNWTPWVRWWVEY